MIHPVLIPKGSEVFARGRNTHRRLLSNEYIAPQESQIDGTSETAPVERVAQSVDPCGISRACGH